ncbi:MAG: T9SS type A sorting domain-containing protein [Bacteroidales bacterium]|nr:T9SS type A sorting domain-containing protein [Bacteroidales bacterium]
MKRLTVFLFTLIIVNVEVNAQLQANPDFKAIDRFKRITNKQVIKNYSFSEAKSGDYQKLDSVIRPDYSIERHYYNDKGLNIEVYYYYYYSEDNYKEEYIYDTKDNLILVNGYDWNANSGLASKSWKIEVTYYNHLISSITQFGWKNNQWRNSYREEYTYTQENNVMNHIYSVWDTVASQWTFHTKSDCSYDSNNNRIEEFNWIWDNNQWSNDSKVTYLYNENGNMILYTSHFWDLSSGIWVQSDKWDFTYDEFNRPILAILTGVPDHVSENELWRSDGTADGTFMVKDIYPGSGSGFPSYLTNINDVLFFSACDGINGTELWRSDGTAGGTSMIKDICSGPDSSYARYYTNVNGTVFFSAMDRLNGMELWKTDGTPSGTVMVKNIYPYSGSSGPYLLTNINGLLYFSASDGVNGNELWKSDGTGEGTIMVKDISSGSGSGSPFNLVNVNGILYFSAFDANGRELWRSDGTSEGTIMVKDISPGSGSGSPSNLSNVNGLLYFSAGDGVNGYELWRSDGTSEGTIMVKDIHSGSGSGAPSNLTNLNGILYFTAYEGSIGRELWKSDGTSEGTVMVKDISPGSGSGSPSNLTNVNGLLYFTANDGVNGSELWKSNGTTDGTVMVKDIYTGSASGSPLSLNNSNGILYFSANTGNPWVNWRKIIYSYSYTCSPDNLILPYFREYYYDGFVDITAASFTMHRWDENVNDWYVTYTKDKYFSKITMLTVSTDSIALLSPESCSITFDIISSTYWTVTSNQDWLSVTSSKGLGESTITGSENATITLTAAANQTGVKRTAIVTVSGTGVSDRIITVTQEGILTGISGRSEELKLIYPNPASDILYLNGFEAEVEVFIYDISGRIVLSRHITDNQININNLQVGIYIMKIKSNAGILRYKFIKN